jgi:transketolase
MKSTIELQTTVELANKIRKHALRMTSIGGSSHIGSILSMSDILAVLYGKILNVDPLNPKMEGRDRFILSKGHAGAGVYAALAETGFFAVSKLDTHYQNGSDLSGHVSHKGIPGVEISTGSLGHGLPIGAGMAYAAKLSGKKHRVFVLLGDGECDEGSNWEAIMFAAHHKLDNLIAIIDYNKLQSITTIANTLALEPFADKWRSFGWGVQEIDGHNHQEITTSCLELPFVSNSPSCILAHTIKGKGVSFMENSVLWHYRSAQNEEYANALNELEQ